MFILNAHVELLDGNRQAVLVCADTAGYTNNVTLQFYRSSYWLTYEHLQSDSVLKLDRAVQHQTE